MENKTNFEGAYFGNGFSLNSELLPWRNLHRRIHLFLFREGRATDAWKQNFLYSCIIHTCLSRALGFLGHTGSVSWIIVSIARVGDSYFAQLD